MPILPPLPRPQRRRIHKIIHATRDKGHARRLMAILLLHEGRTITDVHHLTGAARSTIGRWLRWYRDEGVGALEALPAGRAPILPVAKFKLSNYYISQQQYTLLSASSKNLLG